MHLIFLILQKCFYSIDDFKELRMQQQYLVFGNTTENLGCEIVIEARLATAWS